MTLKVLDLFSGIGGFSLGLERAGMTTAAFCEIDPYCRAVLAKHWPGVPIYDDVRKLTTDALSRDGIAVDVICGGFPCQDLSFAGKRAGLEGARSGLWGEYARLIGELRPRFVIVENVPGLLSLGMGRVLGDLSALGYDATWDCVPACAIGAPHRRDRVWIVAYAAGDGREQGQPAAEAMGHGRVAAAAGRAGNAPDALGDELRQQPGRSRRKGRKGEAVARYDGAQGHVANSSRERPGETGQLQPVRSENGPGRGSEALADADSELLDGGGTRGARRRAEAANSGSLREANVTRLALGQGVPGDDGEEFAPALGTDWWEFEPDVGRVAHGVPARVDRLRALGNAVVPQIPEMIGRAILEAIAA